MSAAALEKRPGRNGLGALSVLNSQAELKSSNQHGRAWPSPGVLRSQNGTYLHYSEGLESQSSLFGLLWWSGALLGSRLWS